MTPGHCTCFVPLLLPFCPFSGYFARCYNYPCVGLSICNIVLRGPASFGGFLVRGTGAGRRRPILRREIDTPEMRTRRQKFDTHARALIGKLSEVHHAALLL